MSSTPAPVATPEWPRIARYVAGGALVALVVLAIIFIRPVASVIATGALIAVVTGYAARWLIARTRLRLIPAVIIVYAALIALIVLLAVTIFPWVVRGLEVLLAALRSEGAAGASVPPAGAALGQQLELIFTTAQIQRLAYAAVDWVITLLTFLLGSVARGVYVLGLGLFLSLLIHLDLGGRGLRLFDRLPPPHRREVRLLWGELWPLWTRFVGASLIFAGIVGVGSLIQFVVVGVPFPFLMALLTALITPIPSIGGLLSSLIVGVVCLAFGSTRFPEMSPLVFAGLVWAVNAIITQVAYNFVLMPILSKAVRLPVSIVLIGVIASFAVDNILFAFLVVPVLASLRIIVGYLHAKIERREPFPSGA